MIVIDPFKQYARGDPIPGSALFRNYCQVCGDPIRVPASRREARNCECDGCRFMGRHRRPRRLSAPPTPPRPRSFYPFFGHAGRPAREAG